MERALDFRRVLRAQKELHPVEVHPDREQYLPECVPYR